MVNSEGLGRLGKTAWGGQRDGGRGGLVSIVEIKGRVPATEIFHGTLIWSNINQICEIKCSEK